MRVLILGAGGHAQVVADALLCAGRAGSSDVAIGYLDDDPHLHGRSFLALPVWGSLDRVGAVGHDALIIAIGDNHHRRAIFERLLLEGERFATVIHPHSTVAADVQVGPGSMICAGVVVNTGTTIGQNVILNTACSVDHHCRIGDHVHVAPGAHIGGNAQVGSGTLVGMGSSVISQRLVGDWCIVGAGSAVAKDIPPRTTVIGVPAEPMRSNRARRD